MNILINLWTQFFGNWVDSLSHRFSKSVKNLLLSSFVNNILGNITALSFMSIVFISALSYSNYSMNPQLINTLLTTSLVLFFTSLFLTTYMTRTKKIKKMLGLNNKKPARSLHTENDLLKELLPLVKDYVDKSTVSEKTNRKVDKLEEALVTTTQVLQDLDSKIDNLDKGSQNTDSSHKSTNQDMRH